MKIKKLLCLIAFPLSLLSQTVYCPNANLTLKEAIQNAYANRSSIKARHWNIKKARSHQFVELSGYLPQIQINALPWLASREDIFDKNAVVITFEQLIFSFAGPAQLYKIAQIDTKIAQHAQALEYDKVRFETELSYLELWNVKEKDSTIHYLDSASQMRFLRAVDQYSLALINTTTYLEEGKLRAEAESFVARYPDELSRAKFAFERATEQPGNCNLDSTLNSNYLNYALSQSNASSLTQYLQQALHHRKERRIVCEEIKKAYILESYYLKSYLPSVFLFGFYIHNGFLKFVRDAAPVLVGFRHNFWFFGLNFAWRFDGFGNASRASVAEATSLEKEFEKKDLEHQITFEVQTAYKELEELKKQLKALEASYEQAHEEFNLRTMEHEIGQISSIDYEAAKYRWENEQYRLQEIKVRIAQKYSELMFKSGYPNEQPCNLAKIV